MNVRFVGLLAAALAVPALITLTLQAQQGPRRPRVGEDTNSSRPRVGEDTSSSRPRVGEDTRSNRPRVGETPNWLKKWWSLSTEQRRQGGVIVNEKGGDLNPRLNDPAVRTWRDKNGFNVRPIEPESLRSAILLQQDFLGDMKQSIEQQEADINTTIRESNNDFFDSKTEEAQLRSRMNSLELDKSLAETRWAISRYDRCPNGEPWSQCSHYEEKQAWERDRDRALSPILSGIRIAEEQLADAREKGNQAYENLQKARQQKTELQNSVENYQFFLNKQKRGEPFLFMPK